MATTASCTVVPFTHTRIDNNHTADYYNNNNNNNNTRARAREGAQEIIEIHEAYEDVLGRQMPRFVEREVMGMIADGVEPAMVRTVLEYTACAPRPSWAYARTVIIRNMEKGITTASKFLASLGDRGRAGDDSLPY